MLKCAQCSTAIDLGREVLGVQLGVVGPNGFVQLEDMGQLDHVGIVEFGFPFRARVNWRRGGRVVAGWRRGRPRWARLSPVIKRAPPGWGSPGRRREGPRRTEPRCYA